MSQRLGEDDDRTGRRGWDDDLGRVLGVVLDSPRRLIAALVAAGDAAEAAVVRTGVGEVPGDDDQAVQHAVFGRVVALAWRQVRGDGRGAEVGMQTAALHALAHAHAVEAVEAEAVAQPQPQNGHDRRMVEQVAEGLAPLQEPRGGAADGGRTAEARALAGLGDFALVEQGVEGVELIFVESVFDDYVALEIEEVLLEF